MPHHTGTLKTLIACQANFARFFALARSSSIEWYRMKRFPSCEFQVQPSTKHLVGISFPSGACTFLKETGELLRRANFVLLI